VLLATRELVLEAMPSGDRPQATHFIAGVGKETVRFSPEVPLTGKAENYLLSLLLAQIETLSKCLALSVARYPQMARIEWVMLKGPDAGSVDPAQIVLLVAQIDFVQQVQCYLPLLVYLKKTGRGNYLTSWFT
jgi:hypothetical protein